MSKKSNPVDKLVGLPEIPENEYWWVERGVFGIPQISLYRKHKYWFDTRVDHRLHIEGGMQDDKYVKLNLEEGLIEAAWRIYADRKHRKEYSTEINNLYDTKVYLDELIPTRELCD